jgi:putative ABC transport system permease protein
MGAIAVRNLWERKLRTILTSLAIVLGVMMVAGTYVLTDTIDRSFERIFTQSNEGIDAVVTSKQNIDTFDDSAPSFPASVLKQVKGVGGVAAAEGSIADQQLSIIGEDGDPRGGNGAPSLGFSVSVPYSDRFDPLTYVEGGPPMDDDQVVIDKASAEDEGFEVGDAVTIAGRAASGDYTLSGIATLGDVDSFGGATIAVLTLPEAQRLTGKEGELDQISVAADEGVSPDRLAASLKAALPTGLDVETGAENIESQRDDIGEFTGFIKTALLIFAGIALFVGAFLIFNTFSITVAQRTREFAMLRTLGASRRQILSTVVLEAAVIGLGASIVGVAFGIGFAEVISDLFAALGLDLPATGTVVEPRTVIVGLLLGTLLAVASGLGPAMRATRVPPVTGLRDGVVPSTTGERRRRTSAGVVLAALGAAAMALGIFGALSPGEAWVGVGAVAVFLGVALLSPLLVTPVASVVGAPLERLGGVPGTLARENSVRNPGRTASTAAALMIGLALVSFVAVFAAGIKGSIDDAIDKTLIGDLTISNDDGFSDIPIGVRDEVAAIDGVEVASALRFTEDEVDGESGTLTLVDPTTAAQVIHLDWDEGSDELLSNLAPDQAVVDKGFAEANGLDVGSSFVADTISGDPVRLTVVGTFTDNSDFIGDYAASDANAEAFGEPKTATNVFINLEPDADAEAVRAEIESALGQRFPTVQVQNQEELKDAIGEQLNQLLGIIYVLLLLSVVVSLFGIVNTLALTIHERTRELGLLRAVGTSRRQIRRTVRYEAVITAMIGGVLGLTLGVLFAVLVSRPLADEGFTLSIPVGQLIGLMVLSALAGVLAAIGPARRASRLDVLEALAYE